MTLNLDYIRDILVSISDELVPDEDGIVTPISPQTLYLEKLTEYPQNETLYWIGKLMEENILIKGKKYIDEPIPQIKDISMIGYQFIDSIKAPSAWSKIKPKLSGMAFSSITTLINAVISLTFS